MYKITTRQGAFYRCSGRGAKRRGCGTLVSLAADALMDEIMSGLRRPVQRPVFHPAEGYQVELDDVAQQLRDLPARAMPRKEEQAERERLWDEQDRLAGLPAKAAWTEWVPVLDEAGAVLTVGAKWQASDGSARRQWLLEAGFTMRLSKPDMVREGGPDEGAVFSQTDAYFSEEAAIVFEWNGDEDAGLGAESAPEQESGTGPRRRDAGGAFCCAAGGRAGVL